MTESRLYRGEVITYGMREVRSETGDVKKGSLLKRISFPVSRFPFHISRLTVASHYLGFSVFSRLIVTYFYNTRLTYTHKAIAMFKNYLKVAFRSIRKNKLYSLVNIIGLTTGITGCILIGLYVWNELSYDKFHRNGDRIARVTMEYSASGTVSKVAVTGTKVGPQLKRTFPRWKRSHVPLSIPVRLPTAQKYLMKKMCCMRMLISSKCFPST